MKKRYLAIILALTAALAGCGKVDDSSKAEKKPAAASEAQQESETSEAEVSEAESEAASEAEVREEPSSSEKESSDESSSVSEADTDASEDSTSPDPHSADGTVRPLDFDFTELYESGLGNIEPNGDRYALVSDGGGAGHAYFTVMFLPDGGDWVESGMVQFPNGENSYFHLDDGGIILFSMNNAYTLPYPTVHLLYVDQNGIPTVTDYTDTLSELVLKDGSKPQEGANYSQEVSYSAGFTFSLKLTDNDTGDVVYDDYISLDPLTMELIQG
ncbi:MAG: hypothetical protein IJ737_00500 [Ruminococcus sp.]|nr:hypothetical protein [Ruminococcus sp.]